MDRITDHLKLADLVQVDGLVFETAWLRVPDEATAPDEVIVELSNGEEQLQLTRAELDEAMLVAAGTYRLPSGSELRLVKRPTVH